MKTTKIKIIAILLFQLMTFSSYAQVTFVVESLPANTPPQDYLFIAGDFNGWNPGVQAYRMQKNEQEQWTITLDSKPEGSAMLYKFTRGSWETVEKGAAGEEISNRSFTFGNRSTIPVSIQRWADNGGGAASTAAANVTVLDENFYMPQLNRHRRIWVYLPAGYETSGLHYPVLYMHDGQNLFDVLTSFSGEWDVDETLNELAAQGHRVPIVVGIDNGGVDRIGEYTPWSDPQYGGGDGDLYIRFITETLKPAIDQLYRTLPDRNNTALMGSSLGGLISHYGVLKYQEIFSKAGLFSPSYWYSDSVWQFTRTHGRQHNIRFFHLCGTLEGGNTVTNMLRMNDSLVAAGFSQDDIFNKVVTGGQHNEALWRSNFAEAIQWLFESGAPAIDEPEGKTAILFFPNPVENELTLEGLPVSPADSVVIYSVTGLPVKSLSGLAGNKINVSDLKSGSYLLRILHGNHVVDGKFIKK